MEIPEKVAFSVVAFPNIKLLHVPLLARRVGLVGTKKLRPEVPGIEHDDLLGTKDKGSD